MTRFARRERSAETEHDLRARRFLWASATAAPLVSGLRAAIDEAVELALALRGALPPRVEPGAAIESVIADQVFRARALGAAGLALALPRLSGAGDALAPDDSAALLAWLRAAREAPVALVFDEADRAVQVLAPVPLVDLVVHAHPGDALCPSSREQPRPLADAAARTEPSARRAVREGPSPEAAASPPTSPPDEAVGVAAAPTDIEAAPLPPAPAEPRADGRPRGVLPPRSRLRRSDAPPAGPAGARRPETIAPSTLPAAADLDAGRVALQQASGPAHVGMGRDSAPADPSAVAAPAAPAARAPAADGTTVDEAAPELDAPPTRREPPKSPRSRALHAAEWRSLAVDLDNARGPKPVRVIEQLFATHYTPLLGATLSGEADAAVRAVVEGFRASFEHSYREAFSALRVTGKRPPMVFDAPDIAGRLARLNGARGVKLLLVDAMRFDLGEQVATRVKAALGQRAILIERSLLWAALPTTTTAQLALLARGPEGLRDVPPSGEAEPAIARGRAVATLRRERVGARELMKLDLVEARLRAAGPPYPERLEAIADEVADVIARFIDSLPPRTLLLVFGDHGFRLAPLNDGSATGPATQGGCSPEEVLVPAQAWLVGGVH